MCKYKSKQTKVPKHWMLSWTQKGRLLHDNPSEKNLSKARLKQGGKMGQIINIFWNIFWPIFWNGSDNKYFQLTESYRVCCNYLPAIIVQKQP